jgi:tricorn protease
MRIRFILAVWLLTWASVPALAALWPLPAPDPERPLWLRTPAISPDGSRIAFTHGGQVWLVPSTGGEARALTSDQFYSHHPVWSPDGQRIAFASRRHGNDDVFVMPAEGGAITRLTHHSAHDVPQAFSPDGRELLFASARLGSAKADALDASKGLGGLEQLYTVPASGGRPTLLLPTPALDAKPSADGQRLLYTDRRSTENEWRKHHVSDAARDVWLFDRASGSHRRLTDFRGEDRNAVWSPKEDAVLWLSERSGSFNVWRQPLAGGAPQQVTQHKDHPVRFLSSARDGSLVYSYAGELWRLPAGADQPQRVPVRIHQGNLMAGPVNVNLAGQATELAVSPTAPEFALVARGEVFVVSALTGQTRRITHTPAEERHVSFSPDGRTVFYASERAGNWDVMAASLRREQDQAFTGAAPFEEEVLVGGEADAFQPLLSPDGKHLAYRQDRVTLRVLDLQSGRSVEVLGRDAVYSYSEDDLHYAWSPDGRWLVSRTGFDGRAEVELLDATGRQPRRNISRSGFMDLLPQVSDDGKTVLWISDRVAPRTADTNPAALDVFAAFLTPEAFEAFAASPDERARQAAAAAKPAASKAAASAAAPALPDLNGIERRTVRLTPFSVVPSFYRLTPDGRTLLLVGANPMGVEVGYAIDLPSRQPRVLFQRPPGATAAYEADAEGKQLFALGAAGIDRYDVASGKQVGSTPFNAEMTRDAQAEIAAIFDHAWRLTQVKFYDPKLHGVDWAKVGADHRRYLPYVRHWEELAEILSEMVGELNASHQAGRFSSETAAGDATASLGLYTDDSWRGAGLRVAEVLAGGPADRSRSALQPGAVLLAIDGQPLTPDTELARLLNRKAGQPVLVSVRPAVGGQPVEQTITPVSLAQEAALAYHRWVDKRRALVEQASGGRIGYLHIPAMNLPSYLQAYSDLFGRHLNAEAVLVDVRFNGGGNLHDPLVAMLTGQIPAGMVTRDGTRVAEVPATRWTKPSALIANAGSYSDGSVFPSVYQRLKIGPVLGESVPGTGTAVLWEHQLDKRLVYGVPQLGFLAGDGRWFENQEIVPEVPVAADPVSVAAGRDPQLERGVQVLLQQIGPARGAK